MSQLRDGLLVLVAYASSFLNINFSNTVVQFAYDINRNLFAKINHDKKTENGSTYCISYVQVSQFQYPPHFPLSSCKVQKLNTYNTAY